MSRGLSSGFKAEIDNEVLRPALFVKASFSSELRLWTGHGSKTLASQIYDGAGDLLSITNLQENSDLGTSGLSLTLSGANPTIVNAIKSQEFQGNELTVYLAVLFSSGNVRAHTVFFKGLMDNATYYQSGDSVTIKLDVENHLSRLSRTNKRMYTSQDQKSIHPYDKGLDYIESIADQKLVWGA